MGCRYALEPCTRSMLTGNGHNGVRLGQGSLLPPGWFLVAHKWLSGGVRVSERGAAACPDLDTVLVTPLQIHCFLSRTPPQAAGSLALLRAGRGPALFQCNFRMSELGHRGLNH